MTFAPVRTQELLTALPILGRWHARRSSRGVATPQPRARRPVRDAERPVEIRLNRDYVGCSRNLTDVPPHRYRVVSVGHARRSPMATDYRAPQPLPALRTRDTLVPRSRYDST